MHPDTGMKLDTAFKLFCVPELGPRLMDRLLALFGYAIHPIDPGGGCYERVSTITANALAILARALEDHRVDHLEKPVVDEALKLVVAEVQRLPEK